MKGIIKIVIFVLIVVTSGSFSSCSRKSTGFTHSSSNAGKGSSYDPVAPKNYPVRKKFVINQRRAVILGHKKPSL
ncbi:MAG: hypothetical protein WC341_07115 [Bacteroidales bacterium]|jgi:hypothetical protein